MMDRGKVKKGLEIILNGCDDIQCEDCRFHIKEPTKPRRCGMIEEQIQEGALALLKEQEAEISRISNAYLELVEKASKQPKVVRCKDCKHRGDRHKYLVAFVAEKQEMPYFFYDNRGEWFYADGERQEVK